MTGLVRSPSKHRLTVYAVTSGDGESDSDWYLPICFSDNRHFDKIVGSIRSNHTWRMKERMKTVSVALVLCLNVGVDPPDVLKIQPCARLECWIDPFSIAPRKALENIGGALQKQYERWQPRARSKLSLDPTLDEVKKLCQSLRRNAKDERVLFHYNGHGVPKPTENGEIWVFNKTYTQYIPLSLYNLQTWMGIPSIYVFDCSSAGLIIEKFTEFQHQRDGKEPATPSEKLTNSQIESRQCILLGACSSNEILPQTPELPADLFTACLTTPIKMALKWHILQNEGKVVKGLELSDIDKIPGQLNDRRTMMGELNWIFTAITDTIAWNVLAKDTFQKLFRQDLLVASLFRNFLLAERIMRSYNCTPISNQGLPANTHQHHMWHAWDYTLDHCLSLLLNPDSLQDYCGSPFFAEQLTAFEVWLSYGPRESMSQPEQLPIVLQVLLSQVHRSRALELLSRFLDYGSDAVSLALSVGIFPYVLKLLQSSARDLRSSLVFIWAKILSVDSSCQSDLVKDQGHKYFLSVLDDRDVEDDYRVMAAFVLSMIVDGYKVGQENVLQSQGLDICLTQLEHSNPKLRRWCALCLAKLWSNMPAAKWSGVRDNAHVMLFKLLEDDYCEVRTAAIYALGTFINQNDQHKSEHTMQVDQSVGIKLCQVVNDASPMVREELLAAFSSLIASTETQFILAFSSLIINEEKQHLLESPVTIEKRNRTISASPSSPESSIGYNSAQSSYGSSENLLDNLYMNNTASNCGSLRRVASSTSISNPYVQIWKTIASLISDPFPTVNTKAGQIVNALKSKVISQSHARENLRHNATISLPCSPQNRLMSSEQSRINRIQSHRTPTDEQSNGPPALTSTPRSHKSERSHKTSYTAPLVTPPSADVQIKTEFFQWSCAYFEKRIFPSQQNQRQHKTTEEFNELERKSAVYQNNVKIRQSALDELISDRERITPVIESEIFSNKLPNVSNLLRFHPYDNKLTIAETNAISIWDWEAGFSLNKFYNHNSTKSRITGVEYLNYHDKDHTLLAVATDDGCIRVWRDFYSREDDLNLVTAWRNINDNPRPQIKTLGSIPVPGMLLTWQQSTSYLYSSQQSRFITIYDVVKETKVCDLHTGTDSLLTSIHCDPANHNNIITSSADGIIRIFDKRRPAHDSRVNLFQHGNWVVNADLLRDNEIDIVSAGKHGEIKCWDSRRTDSNLVGSFTLDHKIRNMVVHRHAKILACGMDDQSINIYNTKGDCTSVLKYYEGFMAQRIAKPSCLAFHPVLLRLATGHVDGTVTVYSVSRSKR